MIAGFVKGGFFKKKKKNHAIMLLDFDVASRMIPLMKLLSMMALR